MRRALGVVASMAAFMAVASCARLAPEAPVPRPAVLAGAPEPLLRTRGQAQGAFFTRLSALCDKEFPGRATFSSTPDDPMMRARLVMAPQGCSSEQVRVPFRVDGDRSRTWIITLHPGALQLQHDHRHADGTPDEITMYGGWAADGGTPSRARFPADAETAKLIPAAATNVWTLEIDSAKRRFVYFLERDGKPRYRAIFDLGKP